MRDAGGGRRSYRPSVRVRVSLATMAAVGIVLVVAGIVLVRVVEDRLVNDVRRDAVDAVQGVPVSVALSAPPGEFIAFDPGQPAVAILSGDALPPQVGSLPLSAGIVASSGGTFTVELSDRVLAAAPIQGRTDQFLLTVVSLDQVLGTVRGLRSALWIGIPALVALVGLLAWLLVGRALRPVERIRAEVDEITHGTLDRRVPVPSTDDEVAHLAETMNGMLDRLDGAAARQREFVSDAAHELRSPLATIRTTVEVAVAEGSGAAWDDVAGTVVAESDRLGLLVDDLSALALLDEGAARSDDAVDLDELVLSDVRRLRAMGQRVDTTALSAARVRGDRRLLERAIRNLLDNAARHARSLIVVTLRNTDGGAVLLVDDDGPGIAEADRERVFERFARLDEGRARDHGGTGLGLALVRAVAERHGGAVSATDNPFGGTRIELRVGGGLSS